MAYHTRFTHLVCQCALVRSPGETGETAIFATRRWRIMQPGWEVLGRNVFAQTFVLKQEDRQMETVPFSRWTQFFKISPNSRSGRPREIQPIDIRLGDRLCVLLDPSEATAKLILVLEPAPAPLKMAIGPGWAAREPLK